MIKSVPYQAVCVVSFTETGEVLTVTRRNTNIYSLPGGKVDDDESLIDAAVREFHEETDIQLDPQYLIPIYSAIEGEFYCLAYLYNKYIPFKDIWSIESGIIVSFQSAETLLTKGCFIDYNTAVFDQINKL